MSHRKRGGLIVLALAAVACGGSTGPATTAPTGSSAVTTIPDPTTIGQLNTPTLEGTSWIVTNYSSDELGSITNVWEDSEVTISFGTDGVVYGNSGCNEYNGSYGVEGEYVIGGEGPGQTLSIAPLTFTDMACADERITGQEAEYLALLPRAADGSLGPERRRTSSSSSPPTVSSWTRHQLTEEPPASLCN